MSDEGRGTDMPPGPLPVPPLASAPPPVARTPAPPQFRPPPPATAQNRKSFWMAMVGLAFAAGVGVTLLFLWLNGPIGASREPASKRSPAGNAAASSGLNANTSTVAPQVPSPPPVRTGTAPSAAVLEGTWGPECPGSTNESATFYGDGTMEAEGDTGSWSLNGYEVTLDGERETMILRWEMLGNDSARVSRDGGAPRIVNRCN